MVFSNNLLFGAAAAATSGAAAFDPTLIGNSIWLDGSADTLEKTFSSGSAQTKVVISTWVQRYSFGSDQTIFSATGGTGGSTRSNRLSFRSDDTFDIHLETSSVKTIIYSTTAKFRDIGFYHILVSIDQGQTQGPAQVKLFVTGMRCLSQLQTLIKDLVLLFHHGVTPVSIISGLIMVLHYFLKVASLKRQCLWVNQYKVVM